MIERMVKSYIKDNIAYFLDGVDDEKATIEETGEMMKEWIDEVVEEMQDEIDQMDNTPVTDVRTYVTRR